MTPPCHCEERFVATKQSGCLTRLLCCARNDRTTGAVLVIVLWVLAVLTAIALGLSYRTGLEAKRMGAFQGKVQSIALCQAALQRMMFELQKDEQGYDSLKDLWSNNKQLFDRYRLVSGTYTISTQRPRGPDSANSAKPAIFYGALDEESFINVNTATKEVWERLLKAQDLSPDLSEPIMDWVDPDGNARLHGAETPDYASLDRPYGPRNGKISMLQELLLVKDMTPERFKKISPFLTVDGDGKINVNTAGPKVLEAIGFPADLVEKILRYRKGLDETEGTQDDGVFRDVAQIAEGLAKFESVTNADRFVLNNAIGGLTVGSRFFRIHVKAESSAGNISRVTALVERLPSAQGLLPRILSWKEE